MPQYILRPRDIDLRNALDEVAEGAASTGQQLLAQLLAVTKAQGRKRANLASFTEFTEAEAPSIQTLVLDALTPFGPVLVSMSEQAAEHLNSLGLPVMAERDDIFYLPSNAGSGVLDLKPPRGAGPKIEIEVQCRNEQYVPLPGRWVRLMTDVGKNEGLAEPTDDLGRVVFRLPATAVIESLLLESDFHQWGAYAGNVQMTRGQPITLIAQRIDLAIDDTARRYYRGSAFDPGRDITVGVIDTGVGPHSDLNVVSRKNTVAGDTGVDDWKGHGTHVAGLIGAVAGLRKPGGVAPGVRLRSYRVFPKDSETAHGFSIAAALCQAGDDGCDIVNLSLAGGPEESLVKTAIDRARRRGMIVLAAAGNDGKPVVSFPAAYPGCVAVSAMGDQRDFPTDSPPANEIARPPNAPNDANAFIARFSNFGPEIDVTAPGVGLHSTLVGGGYIPMSGTSMAAPVVAGAVASLLSRNAAILSQTRDLARAEAMEAMLRDACVELGFGPDYEGAGLPDPDKI